MLARLALAPQFRYGALMDSLHVSRNVVGDQFLTFGKDLCQRTLIAARLRLC